MATTVLSRQSTSGFHRVPWLVPSVSFPVAALGLFTALTAVMTWPQARLLGAHALEHQDVYFNMWRLGWFAHALVTSPASLFDGNTFYPEPRSLAFSDAMIVEGLVAAPLLWAGVPPVLVHNLLLLGAIVASALGMCVLVKRLTGNRTAAILAGLVFAFAPYRFEHYMHLELQWTVWMPWAFWALHRTLESGRWRDGALAGLFVALQMLSSVYYGVFLATVLPVFAGLALLSMRGPQLLRAARALVLGGLLAVTLCGLYGLPYLAARDRVGERSPAEIARFSARPHDYLVATPDNRIYGGRFLSRSERRLSPGMLAPLLAVVGLILRPFTRYAIAYLVALVLSFEMSLGVYGYTYTFLYENVPLFSGLRAPARMGIFVIMFLGILAGYGAAALHEAVPPAVRRVLSVLLPCVLLLEYSVTPLPLVPYDNSPPQVYEFIKRLPPGVVAEFPMPRADALPGPDPRYTYMSTFHWKPMVNGYSGYYPPTYLHRLREVQSFPDEDSLYALRKSDVKYVVYHLPEEESAKTIKLMLELEARPELAVLGRFKDSIGTAVVYELR
jgi:hypothetical protein